MKRLESIFRTLLIPAIMIFAMCPFSNANEAKAQKGSIDITGIDLVAASSDELVFEVKVKLTNMLGRIVDVAIVPLNGEGTPFTDHNGEMQIAEEMYQLEQADGDGVLQVSMPMSILPPGFENLNVIGMIADESGENILAESELHSWSDKIVAHVAKCTVASQGAAAAFGLIDALIGGSGGGSGIGGGNGECSSCRGTGKCFRCHGDGETGSWGGFETCSECGGSGRCHACGGYGNFNGPLLY